MELDLRTSHTWPVPGRWHLGYSLLGRWLRHRVRDPRRAEAYLILILATLAVSLVLAQYTAWALLGKAILADPTGPTAVSFWLAQVVGLLGFVALGLMGWQPRITVEAGPKGITVQQGRRTHHVPYATITDTRLVAPLTAHRHYARYAATVWFVNRWPDALLLLQTPTHPVLLGLDARAQDALRDAIALHQTPLRGNAAVGLAMSNV